MSIERKLSDLLIEAKQTLNEEYGEGEWNEWGVDHPDFLEWLEEEKGITNVNVTIGCAYEDPCVMCNCRDKGAVDVCRACYNEKAVATTQMRGLLLAEAQQLEEWARDLERGDRPGWSGKRDLIIGLRERANYLRARVQKFPVE